jgi:hypothetical protein
MTLDVRTFSITTVTIKLKRDTEYERLLAFFIMLGVVMPSVVMTNVHAPIFSFEYVEEEVDVFMNGPPGANRNIQI